MQRREPSNACAYCRELPSAQGERAPRQTMAGMAESRGKRRQARRSQHGCRPLRQRYQLIEAPQGAFLVLSFVSRFCRSRLGKRD